MPRVALALSGGGSKGAFTVGVLKVLRQKYGLDRFPIISGTSTGALIGTLLATNDWSTLVDVYSNVRTKNIVNRNYPNVARLLGTEGVLFACALFGGRAIFDTRALERTIALNVDWKAVRDAYRVHGSLLVYSTVDLESGMAETWNNRDDDADVLAKALLASSNQPVLMDPVAIRRKRADPGGNGNAAEGRLGQYVDGGVREYLPLEAVFEHGRPSAGDVPFRSRAGDAGRVELDAIVAVATSPEAPSASPQDLDKITGVLGRSIELLNIEIAKDDYVGAERVNAILRMEANALRHGLTEEQIWEGVPGPVRDRFRKMTSVPLIRISPADHLPMNGLDFEPEKMRRAMDDGVTQALAVLEKEEKGLFRAVSTPDL
jgi:predicted acylesterase/phospholipase RssA